MLLNEKNDSVKTLLKIAGINIIRKRGQLSQEGLAEKARVSRSTIVKIEAGKNISLKSLLKIAKALGVEPGSRTRAGPRGRSTAICNSCVACSIGQ